MTTPGLELVYALARAEDLSVLIDEDDEPERTRLLWENTVRPRLEAVGHSPAQIEAPGVEYEVPA